LVPARVELLVAAFAHCEDPALGQPEVAEARLLGEWDRRPEVHTVDDGGTVGDVPEQARVDREPLAIRRGPAELDPPDPQYR
jgi:hypothetical protein